MNWIKMIIIAAIAMINVSVANAQGPSVWELATDNGVYLNGGDAKLSKRDNKNGVTNTISYKLNPNKTYSLRFGGTEEIEFSYEDNIFVGNFNEITITVGDEPMIVVMEVSGVGKYSYALGLIK